MSDSSSVVQLAEKMGQTSPTDVALSLRRPCALGRPRHHQRAARVGDIMQTFSRGSSLVLPMLMATGFSALTEIGPGGGRGR